MECFFTGCSTDIILRNFSEHVRLFHAEAVLGEASRFPYVLRQGPFASKELALVAKSKNEDVSGCVFKERSRGLDRPMKFECPHAGRPGRVVANAVWQAVRHEAAPASIGPQHTKEQRAAKGLGMGKASQCLLTCPASVTITNEKDETTGTSEYWLESFCVHGADCCDARGLVNPSVMAFDPNLGVRIAVYRDSGVTSIEDAYSRYCAEVENGARLTPTVSLLRASSRRRSSALVLTSSSSANAAPPCPLPLR